MVLACLAQVSLSTAIMANGTGSRAEGQGWHHKKGWLPAPGPQRPLQRRLNGDVMQLLCTEARATQAQ